LGRFFFLPTAVEPRQYLALYGTTVDASDIRFIIELFNVLAAHFTLRPLAIIHSDLFLTNHNSSVFILLQRCVFREMENKFLCTA